MEGESGVVGELLVEACRSRGRGECLRFLGRLGFEGEDAEALALLLADGYGSVYISSREAAERFVGLVPGYGYCTVNPPPGVEEVEEQEEVLVFRDEAVSLECLAAAAAPAFAAAAYTADMSGDGAAAASYGQVVAEVFSGFGGGRWLAPLCPPLPVAEPSEALRLTCARGVVPRVGASPQQYASLLAGLVAREAMRLSGWRGVYIASNVAAEPLALDPSLPPEAMLAAAAPVAAASTASVGLASVGHIAYITAAISVLESVGAPPKLSRAARRLAELGREKPGLGEAGASGLPCFQGRERYRRWVVSVLRTGAELAAAAFKKLRGVRAVGYVGGVPVISDTAESPVKAAELAVSGVAIVREPPRRPVLAPYGALDASRIETLGAAGANGK